jgi:capsule polysaccharide export protein KpsE/RkpR
MPESIDFTPFSILVRRHFRVLAAVTVVAAIAAIVLSGPAFIKPRYRSQAVVYPVNLASYSLESTTDQLLQLLQSNSIRDSVIARFHLAGHYGIDTTGVGWRHSLNALYRDRVEMTKTRYESVDIEVTDEDPVMARDIALEVLHQADLLARRLQRRNSREVLVIMRSALDATKQKIDSVEARLNALRSDNGMLEYASQAKELTRGYVQLIAKGADQAQRNELSALMKDMEEKGGEFRTLSELNKLLVKDYGKRLAQEQQILIDVSKELTYSNMVVYPEVPDRKSWPVRGVVVVITVAAALLLCYILLFLRDRAQATSAERA